VSGYDTIEVERRGPVGWLVFDRPDAGNALNAAMFAELERAWTELAEDPTVRVIVNTGNGASFQTGVDVVQMSRDRDALKRFSRQTRDAELRFTAWHLDIVKPVIAAVNGTCAGGGLHFVADADIVVAASDAQFVDPHVSVGQATAYEGITLVRKSPAETIMRLALVGRHERLSAERARQLGILSQVVDPPDQLRDAAQELAEKIARNSPAAMAATKRALWGALETGLTDACRQGAAHLVSMWDHPDQTEGPAAFDAQRTPEWQEPTP
jgi:enoyl-CoA hydratase